VDHPEQALQARDISLEAALVPVAGVARPMGVHLVRPAGPGRYPICTVCGEMFGLTDHIRDIAARLAGLGYVVAVPDFYHRIAPGIALSYDEAGRQEGLRLLKGLQRAEVLADIAATVDVLRERAETLARTAIVGFSVGGHIAYLAAAHLDVAAAACFYGGWLTGSDIPMSQPEPTLALTSGINGRLLYFVGERDHVVTPAQTAEIERALREAGVRNEMIVYPGVGHGFFCDVRPGFDAAAGDDAWQRLVRLLDEELRR